MPAKGIRDVDIPDRCEREAQIDCIVIGFMMRDGWPWSVEEIAREFDKERADETVKRLIESGLAHRVGDLCSRRVQPVVEPKSRSGRSDAL